MDNAAVIEMLEGLRAAYAGWADAHRVDERVAKERAETYACAIEMLDRRIADVRSQEAPNG